MRTEGWDARVTIVVDGTNRRASQSTDAVVAAVPDVQGTSGVYSDAIGCAETR